MHCRPGRRPGRGIQVVHRSDGSGTTQVFTDYMRAVAPDAWTFGPSSKDWPAGKASGDATKDAAVEHLAGWVLTDGQKLAEPLDYAPMRQSILVQALGVVGL